MSFKQMVDHYLVTALWASTDDNGDPLDKNFDASDLTRRARKQAEIDCRNFLVAVADVIPDEEAPGDDQIGHDFWLTRNGHGVGFWDRPEMYGGQAIADKLSEIAKSFGEANLLVSGKKIIMSVPLKYLDVLKVSAIRQTELPRKGQTRSGYGGNLPTPWLVKIGTQWHRVKGMCWSNSGTSYVEIKGECFIVDWYVSEFEIVKAQAQKVSAT